MKRVWLGLAACIALALNYNGSTTEASAWGARQAARALSDIADGGGIDYPVVWMDVELPGIAPPPTTAGTASTPRRAAG
jgi:hypothetical protein